jgi:hypothetical protein
MKKNSIAIKPIILYLIFGLIVIGSLIVAILESKGVL